MCHDLNITKWRLFNNGDDCTLIVEESDLSKVGTQTIKSWFVEYGYTMKVDQIVRELELISFCQTSPVFEGPEDCDYIMCRNPRMALDKDLLTTKDASTEKKHNYYRDAISKCGLALAGHLPILGSFYHALGRNIGKIAKPIEMEFTGMDMLATGLTYKAQSIGAKTRMSFYIAFGVTPDEQEALEEFYDAQTCSWQEPTEVIRFGQPEHA
jgi:hypothetical protein